MGQCNISHPTPSSNPLLRHNAGGVPVVPVPLNGGARRHGTRRDSRTFDTAESALATPERGSTPLLTGEEGEDVGGNLAYTKGMKEVPLESRIERLFYINLYGQVRVVSLAPLTSRKSSPSPTPTFTTLWTNAMCLSTAVGLCGLASSRVLPCGVWGRLLLSPNHSRPRLFSVSFPELAKGPAYTLSELCK